MSKGLLLHVGCGGDPLPEWAAGYKETRLDIDDTYHPDIIANMTDMGDIGTYDVICCNHALEHLFPYETEKALKEFHRVLNDGGYVVIFVPDLQDIKPTEEVLYMSPAGSITGLDMIYGHRKQLKDKPYMLHKNGFIKETLENEMKKVFDRVEVKRFPYNLMAVGVK